MADMAIMADMRISQKGATVADHRLQSAARRAGIHRHAFADQAIRTDGQGRFFTPKFEILRLMAERGKRKNAAARADRRVTGHDDMGFQHDPVAQHDMRSNMAEGADLDPGAKAGAVFDDSGRVNSRAAFGVFDHNQSLSVGAMIMALMSASATSTPSTIALP